MQFRYQELSYKTYYYVPLGVSIEFGIILALRLVQQKASQSWLQLILVLVV